MRYILILQAEKVSAFAIGRTEFGAPVIFQHNQQGHGQFSQYLAERYGSLFTVVLDSKDEEHHQEVIPALKRSDQKKVLNRLLQQYFPARVLCTATVQNGKKTVGSKVAATITGVGDKNDCQHWLDLLNSESTLVTDIYSLSLLGASLPMASPVDLSLCAVESGSGEYRLMGYENGRLLISRHVTVAADQPSELIEQLLQTYHYMETLASVGQTDAKSEAGEVKVNSGNSGKPGITVIGRPSTDSCNALAEENIDCCQWDTVTMPKGIRVTGQVEGVSALFAMLAAQKPDQSALLEMGHYRFNFISRRVRHLLAAGAICCLGVTVAAAATTARYGETYDSLAELAVYLKAESMPQPFFYDDFEYPIDAVRDSMRLSSQFEDSSQFTPLHFLSALAVDLTVYPELQITAIKWGRSDATDQTGTVSSNHAGETLSVLSGHGYAATIEGYIRDAGAETVSLSGRFNSFVAALKDAGRYSAVTIVESPFAMDRELYTSDRRLPDERQRFLIELVNQELVQ